MDAAVRLGVALARTPRTGPFHTGLVALAGHRHLFETYEPVTLELQLYMATNMRRQADEHPPESGPPGTGGSTTPSPAATSTSSWPSSPPTAPAPSWPRSSAPSRCRSW